MRSTWALGFALVSLVTSALAWWNTRKVRLMVEKLHTPKEGSHEGN
jgi:hypothetical protein